jgi:HPr kinase/phosphorylase
VAEPETVSRILVHGTAIAVDGRAVLIRGPSGAGKSDLALRCLAVAAGPFAIVPPLLVADDQVEIMVRDGTLVVCAPATISGLVEVRGIGIVAMPAAPFSRLVLVADIAKSAGIERLPAPSQKLEFCGVWVPQIHIDPWEISAPLKLLLALKRAVSPTIATGVAT